MSTICAECIRPYADHLHAIGGDYEVKSFTPLTGCQNCGSHEKTSMVAENTYQEAIAMLGEMGKLREFYRTWKVLHADPERRIKLQAAARLVGLSHEIDALRAEKH